MSTSVVEIDGIVPKDARTWTKNRVNSAFSSQHGGLSRGCRFDYDYLS